MSFFLKASKRIQTSRLILRFPTIEDATSITHMINNPKIASMTGTIPHPYSDSIALDWIYRVTTQRHDGSNLAYLICHQKSTKVIGVISLRLLNTEQLNLGYWLGEPYWGSGFCTEAGHALIEMVKLHTDLPIVAKHLVENQPSKKVLIRLGLFS